MSQLILVFFYSFFSHASQQKFDINMELLSNGKAISSPRIIAMAGQNASITQKTEIDESHIELIATDGEIQGNKGILINFTLKLISKDGSRKVFAQPQILAKENEETEISLVHSPENDLTLKIKAQRISH